MTTANVLEQSRIAAVDARVVRLPFGAATTVAGAGVDALMLVLLRLRDGDGCDGYSFLYGLSDRHARLLLESARYFAPAVANGTLAGAGTVSAALEREMAFFGPGLLTMGAASHRMAMTDLTCRKLGVSLGALLGRARDTVAAYVTGFFPDQTIDEVARQAAALYERGFRAFKLSAGPRPAGAEAARLSAIRKRLPDDVKLMVDAGQRWSLPEAMHACATMADLGLEWIEDPIDHRDTAALRLLCDRSAVPIATGENVCRPGDLEGLVGAGVRYVIIDMERIGGIDQWLAAAASLASGPSTVLPHLYPHVALQVVASLAQPVTWIEYVTWFEQLVDYDLAIDNGSLRVPDVVGSGFSLDRSKVEALALSDWETLL